jgi:hypothetical protein
VAANECAFNVYKFQPEYDAMLAAGLIEPTGRISAYKAPIVHIKDTSSSGNPNHFATICESDSVLCA